MKVYFDNVNFSSRSGPNSFAHRLANALVENHEIDIVGKNDDFDVNLCFIEPTIKVDKERKLVQRLDGIWFKPEEFETHNINIKRAYDECNHVIWQTDFDRKMTTKWWGSQKGSVIHNGIEIKEPSVSFSTEKEEGTRFFVCSANWHRQKRLSENVKLYRKLRSKNDFLFVMGSNVDVQLRQDLREFYLGNLTHDQCLSVYRKSDWMIHLAWLDHCPNVVVESLSQGCPVICTDSGGTHEIVRDNGVIIPEDVLYNFELLDYDNPSKLSFSNIQELPKVNVEASYLDINLVAKRYFEVLKNA
jgi:glycosyltransferase involved in cell wall biosynthesis